MIIAADSKLRFAGTAFERLGDVRWLDTREFVRPALTDADAILVRSETRVGKDLLEGTGIRFVGTATIGTDHVDLLYLKEKGITFAAAPGSNANSVAEYVVGAMLDLCERRSWSIAGMTIGIVGVGNVGSKVLRYANALGMRVLLNDPPLADATHDPRYLSLDNLMDADVVSLHVPLTGEGPYPTHHFFGASRIRRMKQGAILINTARGAVAETGPLKDSLGSHHLGGAILDVWEGEPDIDPDLLAAATFGTAHIAGYSFDGKLNAARILFDAVVHCFGIDAVWQPLEWVPSPPFREIAVPRDLQGEDAVRFVVRKCYDIRVDDQALRTILSRPPGARAAAFRALRAKYRDRREFPATTILLPPGSERTATVLSTLGFQVNQRRSG